MVVALAIVNDGHHAMGGYVLLCKDRAANVVAELSSRVYRGHVPERDCSRESVAAACVRMSHAQAKGKRSINQRRTKEVGLADRSYHARFGVALDQGREVDGVVELASWGLEGIGASILALGFRRVEHLADLLVHRLPFPILVLVLPRHCDRLHTD